ncbi:V-type ATPase subunit family protein [Necator americanus]|uniref:V-type proton ATPase subunit a n=1 Tax=Necator americanus TaxID=51031 RepID=W2T9D4_NECAM|nr:V-type ATPase subunit family protein [Necator americanus]ETN78478.1 V-type ATPase subunit family protein [Necator americanus]
MVIVGDFNAKISPRRTREDNNITSDLTAYNVTNRSPPHYSGRRSNRSPSTEMESSTSSSVAASKNVRMWLTKVRKIKSIYHTLNLFNIDVTHKCLIAECWCPISELDRIKMALKRGTEESGSQVPSILNRMETMEPPPTYHKTNKFTRGFQNIVDAYGIATYREVNPVMFGDLGHGTIMLLAALFFILKEKQLEAARIKDESLNIFGSGWTNCYDIQQLDRLQYGLEKNLMLIPEKAYDSAAGPYPIGVDPVWNLAESNKLNFLNSLKMKLSVILGITQMTFGVLLSYQNYK